MQKPAEGAPAKALIFARIQNELVPEFVRDHVGIDTSSPFLR